jgi:2-oxo-4-hydroxy-4-carboxy-5-ureidoimidazoline decarboxylase
VDTELASLNALPSNEVENEFLKCCGSQRWTKRMVDARPFASVDELMAKADRIWWELEPQDWLEAFQSHPKIGENKAAAATSTEAQKWSEAEQSGTRGSAPATMQALADLNRKYEERFGYIFIVCATGKSSEEMLEILRERLNKVPEDELRIAAGEQAKITQLRLNKLIDRVS